MTFAHPANSLWLLRRRPFRLNFMPPFSSVDSVDPSQLAKSSSLSRTFEAHSVDRWLKTFKVHCQSPLELACSALFMMISPVNQPSTSSRPGLHTFSLQRSRSFAVLILPEVNTFLGSLPNLSSADTVHSYSQFRSSTLSMLMLMTTPDHDSSCTSNLQLNLVSLLPPFLPSLMIHQSTARPGSSANFAPVCAVNPSSPQLNPVSFNHVPAFADDPSSPQSNSVSSPPPLLTTFQAAAWPGIFADYVLVCTVVSTARSRIRFRKFTKLFA